MVSCAAVANRRCRSVPVSLHAQPPTVAPHGEKKSFPFLPGTFYGRLAHKPLMWTTAEIERAAQPETIAVPAGKFSTVVYTVKIADGRTGRFFVEEAYPHRIVRWELLPDVSAEMTGSARLEYWRLHNNGDESYLKTLGIKPTVE